MSSAGPAAVGAASELDTEARDGLGSGRIGPDVAAATGPAVGVSDEGVRGRGRIGPLERDAGAEVEASAGPAVVAATVTEGGGNTKGPCGSTPASHFLMGGIVTAATRRFTSSCP
eukprot:6482248-Amphidinium_carterae.1